MKYIWIIMLVVIDAFWIIATILEFIRAVKAIKQWDCDSLFDWIDNFMLDVAGWAVRCVGVHALFLFIYSLLLFFKEG